ncbi:hypothetical protein S144_41 [Shewanella sp. phage 1/44]|uniref:hypothetical protein n=1 Tax=Shewanella sp. phage 1/44 TaxID=1458862 RepID=UPI0004F80E5F|nr:hypothetical protein S144_41 [Shewanella sp. phage 1/44]AHK11755.1 hypothetical protein S144_41 [Shewanella sp. phage 1/44]
MMMNLIIFNPSDIGDIFRAKLEVDADPLAERILVIDRDDSIVINVMFKSGFVVLPLIYSTTKLLTILMIDNDKQYNGAVVDGVSCELVNATALEPAWVTLQI